MKKIKWALAAILIICVAMSACAFSGILAGAQAIPTGVSIDFTGTDSDNYYVTLNQSVIQDSALKVTIYNDSDASIVLRSISSTGGSIQFSDWTAGTVLDAGGITTVGISGTCNNDTVLSVTLTYYQLGNPMSTSETCTAYIFASDSQGYIAAESEGYIPVRVPAHAWGVVTTHTMEPVSTASLTYEDEHEDDKLQARNVIEIYVDRSKYKTWQELNFTLSLYNYVADYPSWQVWNDAYYRDHAFFDKITLSQSSNTGSMYFDTGIGTNGENKEFEMEYDAEAQTGFYLQAGKNATASVGITGEIPTESISTFRLIMREYGQTGGLFGSGLASTKTDEMNPQWDITVYNNDKSALKNCLSNLSSKGLNQASYESGWGAYETALKEAYTVLGSNRVNAQQVAEAITNVTEAYNGLERYAVVYTNQYYYEGNDNSNPVLLEQKIDMQVPNDETYTVDVLVNGTYPEYPFNRQSAVERKFIHVDETTNYTQIINQYYWKVDLTALNAAITAFENTPNKDESDNDIYSADSWEAYEQAAAAALGAKTNLQYFQVDIDAATKALTDAASALVKLDIDVEWLTEGMGWAECIIDNSYDDDYGLGWQTSELFASVYGQELYVNLCVAYNEAVEVTNGNYTKAQADRVCAALWQAINDLRVKDESTKGLYLADGVRHADIDRYGYYQTPTDKKVENNGLRVVYNDILDNTSGAYRLHQSDFTADSWDALQDALYGDFTEGSWACAHTAQAYPTYDGEDELDVPAFSMINNIWFLASQAEYNACRDNLLDKLNNLEWNVEYTALEETLAQAYTYELALYTPSTALALQESIADAQAKLDKLAAPQLYGDAEAVTGEVVAQTVSELESAIAGLKLLPYFESGDSHIVIGQGKDAPIYGEQLSQTAAGAIAHLIVVHESADVVVSVYDNQNAPVAPTAPIGTGYRIVLSGTNGEVYESHTFIIKGDVSGDALANSEDFAAVFEYAFENADLQGVFYEAADLNGDGYVDLCDAVMVEQLYS